MDLKLSGSRIGNETSRSTTSKQSSVVSNNSTTQKKHGATSTSGSHQNLHEASSKIKSNSHTKQMNAQGKGGLVIDAVGLNSARSAQSVENIFLPAGVPRSALSSARSQRSDISELSKVSTATTDTTKVHNSHQPPIIPDSLRGRTGPIKIASRSGSRVSASSVSTRQTSSSSRTISRGAEMESFLLDLRQLDASEELLDSKKEKANQVGSCGDDKRVGDANRQSTSNIAGRSNWNDITIASAQDDEAIFTRTTPRKGPSFPLALYDSETSLYRWKGDTNETSKRYPGVPPNSSDRMDISLRDRRDDDSSVSEGIEEILEDDLTPRANVSHKTNSQQRYGSLEGIQNNKTHLIENTTSNDYHPKSLTRKSKFRGNIPDENTAAIRIQRWYRRHAKRRRSANAALQRLMASKKRDMLSSMDATNPHTNSMYRRQPDTSTFMNSAAGKSSMASKFDKNSDRRKTADAVKEEQRLVNKAVAEEEVQKLKDAGLIKSARSSGSTKTWTIKNPRPLNHSKSGTENVENESNQETPPSTATSTPRHNAYPRRQNHARRNSLSKPLPSKDEVESSENGAAAENKDRLKSLFATNKVTTSPRITSFQSDRHDSFMPSSSITNHPRQYEKKEDKGNAMDTVRSSRSIVDDIFSTLRELEQVEKTPRASSLWTNEIERDANQEDGMRKNAWINDIEHLLRSESEIGTENGTLSSHASSSQPVTSSLTRDRLREHNERLKSQSQHQNRLTTLETFLHTAQPSKLNKKVTEDPSPSESAMIHNHVSAQLDAAELQKLNHEMEKSSQEVVHEVQSHVISQKLELDERQRTVAMLQKALQQQRELTLRQVHETQREWERRMELMQKEHTATVERNYALVDQLIDEKKVLQEKCDSVLQELRNLRNKSEEKIRQLEESHTVELKKIDAKHQAAEKLRREKWEADKTKLIKEMTVKGMEAEIAQLIAGHKADLRKQKQHYEEQLLLADDKAYQNYGRQVEELRQQLTREKEEACQKEREMAKMRYENQIESESSALESQRRRLYAEVQDEKERLTQLAARQKNEHEAWKREMEEQHNKTLESWRREFERSREEQEKRHQMEIDDLQRRLAAERDSWQVNFIREHEAQLSMKEREMRAVLRKERDREIEMVLERLELDSTNTKEECERAAENKIKRIREKYQLEMEELEKSERAALEKYNQMKSKLLEVEGDNERLKIILKQKEKETDDIRQMYEKLNRERENASDIIRQEFAERLVATDEENKRLKTELYETRARIGQETERSKEDIKRIEREKEEELEQVHVKVKEAIRRKEENLSELRRQFQQEIEEWKSKYSTALKRSEHLEGLLEEQRKQLLSIRK